MTDLGGNAALKCLENNKSSIVKVAMEDLFYTDDVSVNYL